MTLRTPTNLLVTGGAGFIGSAFLRHLLTPPRLFQGTVINLDALTYAGNVHNLSPVAHDSRYHFVHGDIRNAALVEHLCDEYAVDTIVHFAAESHVDRSIEGPKEFIETNVIGTFTLLEAARKRPHIHFHHISTDEVYGTLGAEGKFTETTPYQPSSPYSASKAASDHLVHAYGHTYGLSTCISNCSNNYGPYQFPEKLIPLMILNAVEGKPLPVYGKGENVRDWLFVDDHAEAIWQLLRFGRAGETYNVGGNCEKTNLEVLHTLLSLLAIELDRPLDELRHLITYVEDRPGHDFRYAIDAAKIGRELGWTPRHTFAQGMRATVQWYLSQTEWLATLRP